MAKKKQMTEAQIKNSLYDAFLVDIEEADDEWPEFDNLHDSAKKVWDSLGANMVDVKGFKVSLADKAKIRREVEESCLSPAAKKAILAATK